MATAYDDILGKKAPEEKQTTADWQNTSSQPAQGAVKVQPVTVPVRQAAAPVAAVQPVVNVQTLGAGTMAGQTSGQNTLAGTATGQTAVQPATNVQGTAIPPNRPPVTAQNGQSSTGKVPQNNAPAVAQNAPVGHEVTLKTPDHLNVPKELDHDRPLTYTEIYNRLNKFDVFSPEEKARLEKKRKRDAIIAAIGDGISALANLGYTTQYAPNGYDPKNSLSEASNARWTKMWDDYNKNRDKYYTGLLKAREMDDQKTANDWKTYLATLQAQNAKDKNERDQALADSTIKLNNAKITGLGYDNDKKKVDAKYAEPKAKADINKTNITAAAAKKNADANALRAAKSGSGRGGSGGKSRQYTLTVEGRTHTYNNKADYDKAVQKWAGEFGIPRYTTVKNGRRKSTVKAKPISQLGAEVESHKPANKPFNINDHKRGAKAATATSSSKPASKVKPPLN